MKGFIELTKIEFKLLIRNFISTFFALAFPSLMLLIFGGIFGNKPSQVLNGHGTVDVSVPAYTGLIIAVAGIMSLPLTIATYREKKVLKRFMATPMSAFDLLISQIVVNFFMTVIGMIILIIVGKAIFGLHFLGEFVPIAIAFVVSVLSTFSLGLLIASVSPNARSATAIAYLVYFPSLFLTGATFPIELMPKVMANISKAIPLSYAVDLLKGVWLGNSLLEYKTDLIALLTVFLLGITVSVFTFKWE